MRSTSRLRAGLGILACWVFLALVFTPQTYMLNQRGPRPLSVGEALTANAVLFLSWAALTPLVFRLGRRFPLDGHRVARHVLLHVGAAFVFAVAHLLIIGQLNQLVAPREYAPPAPIRALLVGLGATNVMIYGGLVAVSQAITYFRRYQDREFHLVQARLQLLRAQLHPHLLFNTLNAIAELIHQDARRADRTLTQLSDLLRLALHGGNREEMTLKEELQFLRSYVEIQHTLLQDRLEVVWAVDDETLDACVPSLLLQPIVENAIEHGIGPRASGGTVTIEARRDGGTLSMKVVDNGVGLRAAPEATNEGIGLANTRARLRHLYGDAHRFEIRSQPGGGVAVELSMPFRPHHSHD